MVDVWDHAGNNGNNQPKQYFVYQMTLYFVVPIYSIDNIVKYIVNSHEQDFSMGLYVSFKKPQEDRISNCYIHSYKLQQVIL